MSKSKQNSKNVNDEKIDKKQILNLIKEYKMKELIEFFIFKGTIEEFVEILNSIDPNITIISIFNKLDPKKDHNSLKNYTVGEFKKDLESGDQKSLFRDEFNIVNYKLNLSCL
jgi:ribosome-interacting GTPase 1